MKVISHFLRKPLRAGRFLGGSFGSFIADRRGFSAMTFAVSAIPMFGLVGLAVDVGTAFHMKAQIQQAADTVATQLARRSMLDRTLTSEQLVERGKKMMATNLDFTVTYDKFDVQATSQEVEIRAEAEYSTSFSKFVGISKLDISAAAKAKFEVEQADIFVLIDNSPSMLIGATKAEAERMAWETGCEFACHMGQTAAQGDRYQMALQRGYKMRYHAVTDAIAALTDRLKQVDPSGQAYRVGLYHFGSYGVNPVQLAKAMELSNDFTAVKNAANNLMPMYGNTYTSDIYNYLGYMQNEMRAKKIGSRPQILLFISDGMYDFPILRTLNWTYGTSFVGPVDRGACANLKYDGVQLATLYVPYFLANGTWSDKEPLLRAEMKACASPGLDAAVSTTDLTSYQTQMELLIQKAGKKSLRLVRN